VVNEAAKQRWEISNGFFKVSVSTLLEDLDPEPGIVCRSCGEEVYGQYIRDSQTHLCDRYTVISAAVAFRY
jgi:hypothetical protein